MNMSFVKEVRNTLNRKPIIINVDESRDDATIDEFLGAQERGDICVTSSSHKGYTNLCVAKTDEGMSHFMNIV